MTATLTTVNALLKEMYEGETNDQLNDEAITIKRIERTSEGVEDNIGGQHVVFPVRTKRNAGISYRAEDTQLASPGKQGYARALENLQYGYGRFQITGPAMALAETKPQTFMSAMDGEMEGLKDDLVKDSNRIAWGHVDNTVTNGGTGILGKLSAYTAGTPSITVDNPRNFDIDMVIDVINPTGSVVRGTVTVTDVDYDTGIVTISGTVTGAAANDYAARTGNFKLEPYGILALVGASGTVHGIDSSAAGNGYWKSVVDSTTTTLTEQSMIALCDKIRQNSGGKPSAIFCSLGVRRAYYNIQLSLRRYMDPKEFPGGLVGLSFNHGKEIPLVEDPDAPAKHAAFLEEKEMKHFRKKDWYFEDSDGAILKWVDDYDKFQGLMKKYWQLGTHKRGAHGLMSNITEPSI